MSKLPLVTADSITVHRQGGLVLPFSKIDDTGAVVDISARTIHFKTASGLDVPLVADPSNATGLLISLSEANIQTIAGGVSTEFAVVDQTAVPDEVLWAGELLVAGF